MARRAVVSALIFALAPAFVAAVVAAQPVAPVFPRPAWSSSASVSASAPSPRADTGIQPDPPPLTTKRKWIYKIIYDGGGIFVPTPVAIERSRASETPRKMGRFLFELYVGKTLLDRVRFDIPLLTGEWIGEKRPADAPADFERGLRTSTSVEVPDSARATYAVLVDRATGRRLRVPWPAADLPTASSASASASAAPSR